MLCVCFCFRTCNNTCLQARSINKLLYSSSSASTITGKRVCKFLSIKICHLFWTDEILADSTWLLPNIAIFTLFRMFRVSHHSLFRIPRHYIIFRKLCYDNNYSNLNKFVLNQIIGCIKWTEHFLSFLLVSSFYFLRYYT